MKMTQRAEILPVAFFQRPAERVAQELIGARVLSGSGTRRSAGLIVETEAYLGRDDPASHGFRLRRSPRNQALFGPPGSWYVYLSYGIHWCSNLVCNEAGSAAAVLIRALEPLTGLEVMRRRRNGVPDRELCSGPGKLCQALGVTRRLDGRMMEDSGVIVLRRTDGPPLEVRRTPRIGITKAADWPLRFILAESPWVSRRYLLDRG